MKKLYWKAVLILALLAGMAFALEYPPGLSYSTVLNGIKMRPSEGALRLDNIQATFLPDGAEGYTVLRKADGEKNYRFDWKTQLIQAPYSLLDEYKCTDLRNNQQCTPGFVSLKEPGNYVLDFYAADGLFYTFPFAVSKLAGSDPFAGGDAYFLEGDWSKYGYLFYSGANPEQSLIWKVWLRNKAIEREKDVKVRVEIIRDKDKKLICTSREGETKTLNHEWVRYEFDMIFPMEKTSYGQYFKAKDLLAVDGAYTLTMKIDDKPYGTWKFSVTGGKLNYTGRTDRGKADPLTFIEGGRDAWWYGKQ